MIDRREMKVVEFGASFIVRVEHRIVIALFDGDRLTECVAVLKCSDDAARALMAAIGSALTEGTS